MRAVGVRQAASRFGIPATVRAVATGSTWSASVFIEDPQVPWKRTKDLLGLSGSRCWVPGSLSRLQIHSDLSL